MRVVYNSFNGRYADNPRALHQALVARGADVEHVWLVDERHRAGFPADVTTAAIRSPQAVAALDGADVVVANTHMDQDAWALRPGGLYLQTWHGTPLKRIHGDAITQYSDEDMRLLQAEVDRWGLLVGPGGEGSELLRRAFRYAGPVLGTGYPRNDVLHAPDRADRRADVRRRLGLRPEERVLLYAPTWRDDEDHAAPGVRSGLDAARLADHLGEGWRVLVRLHYFVQRDAGAVHERVLDVGAHPDIAELYLAADAFVTDYSSSLFDVAPTDLPVVLFAYDLEHYRDRLRGFYLDLDEESPGPVVRTQDELEAVLDDLPAVTAAWGPKREAFVRRWAPMDDGRATERLLEQVGL